MRRRIIIAGTITACCAILATAGFFVLAPEETSRNRADIYIGDVRLAIPTDYLRFEHAQSGGRLPDVDLAADARTFRAARLARKFQPEGPDPLAQHLFLTLRPPEGKLAPAERKTRLYARFLHSDQWSHPGGLKMRRFLDESPYEREDLYFTPPEGRLFAARCRRPPKMPDGLPNTCTAELRIEGIDVRVRFSPDLLSDWEKLVSGVRGLLQSFRRQ